MSFWALSLLQLISHFHFHYKVSIFFFTGCNCSPPGHANNETTRFPYRPGHREPDPHHPHLVHGQPPGQQSIHRFILSRVIALQTFGHPCMRYIPCSAKPFSIFFYASNVSFKFSEFVSIFSLPSQICWAMTWPISPLNKNYPNIKRK